MLKLLKLYKTHRRRIECYDSTMPYEEFQRMADPNTKLYIVCSDELNRKYSLDFSHMITDQVLNKVATWDDFLKLLTESILIGYACTIPGYSPGTSIFSKQIISWDVMNTTNTFTVNYADHISELQGIFPARWKLLDLSIQLQDEATSVPNLKNCIPIINGFCRKPYYDENNNTFYAIRGTSIIRPYTQHTTPEVQLLDLSQLGDISIYKLVDSNITGMDDAAKVVYKNRTGKFTPYANWSVYTPFSLFEYTPLLVIGGIVLFPDEYTVINEHCLEFNPATIPFHVSEALKLFHLDCPILPSAVAYQTEDLQKIITTQFSGTDDVFCETFIVVIHNPCIYMNRTRLDVWNNNIIMNSYQNEGLLIHDTSHCIRVFHKEILVDRQELIVQNSIPLYRGDMLYPDKQVSCIEPDSCTHLDLQNIATGNFSMIVVTG